LRKSIKTKLFIGLATQKPNPKLEVLFKQTEELYQAGIAAGEIVTTSKAFSILSRFIKEQTNQNECGRLIPKPGKEISPQSLQNPTDPDATYRQKYGDNIGYVGNVLNAFDGKNQLVMHYDIEPNIHSDPKFTDETIDFVAATNPVADNKAIDNTTTDNTKTEEEKVTLITDGSYYTDELSQKAANHNINFIPGELTGAKPNPGKLGYDKFKIDEETYQVIECPNGQKPDES
jgi:hypothetical protein